MKTNSDENNYIKISPIHLPLKSHALQTSSISKDYSSLNNSREEIINLNPINIQQTIKNVSKYIHIINYQNVQNKNNFSTIPEKESPKEGDRGKFTNSKFKGKFNFNPIIKKTYYQTIRYKPKRATNFPSLKLNIKNNKAFFRNGNIDIEQPLNRLKLENNIKSSDNILDLYKERIDEEMINRNFSINSKKVINLKSEQIKFFSKISTDYTIFKKYINFISDKNKITLNLYLTQLTNLIELQRNELFIYNSNYNYFETPEKDGNNTNKNINSISQEIKPKDIKRVNMEEQKVHNLFNNKTMFKFLNINTDYNSTLNKCLSLVFTELKELKERNINLEKINKENDILLNQKINQLKEVDKYLNSIQAKTFLFINQKKENIEQKKNQKKNIKKNNILLDYYKLNYEMKDLLILLERNRDYYNKYKEIEKREKINNSENIYMKAHLTKELEKKDVQYKNEIELNNDLNEQIINLEETINDLKNTIENMKMQEIQFNSKIKRLYDVINERNENLKMMNEELSYFYMMYNKEIKNHENTKLLLIQYQKS